MTSYKRCENEWQMWHQEWLLLQQQYQRYEFGALIIKLMCVALFVALIFLGGGLSLQLTIVCIMWGVEAIWKTFQSRYERRLYTVEAALQQTHSARQKPEIKSNSDIQPMQLHTGFQAGRVGGLDQVKEYATQLLRPTIAYPYTLLIVVSLLLPWL